MAAHDATHKASIEELENFKKELKAGYKSISGEVENVSNDLNAAIKKTKDALMELISGKSGK